jgi:hypothetical protein
MRTIYNIFSFILFLGIGFGLVTQISYASNQYQNKIIPFHSVNGIIPGFAKYSDIEKQYGIPEEIEVTKKEKVAGITVGGNKIIHYRSKGLSFLISKNSVVEAIYVERPYAGKSPCGLFLGMTKKAAIKIINKNYYIAIDLNKSLLIAKSSKHANNFQVWFTDGILTRMKLFDY